MPPDAPNRLPHFPGRLRKLISHSTREHIPGTFTRVMAHNSSLMHKEAQFSPKVLLVDSSCATTPATICPGSVLLFFKYWGRDYTGKAPKKIKHPTRALFPKVSPEWERAKTGMHNMSTLVDESAITFASWWFTITKHSPVRMSATNGKYHRRRDSLLAWVGAQSWLNGLHQTQK